MRAKGRTTPGALRMYIPIRRARGTWFGGGNCMIRVKSLWMDYEEQLTGIEDMPLFGWVLESD